MGGFRLKPEEPTQERRPLSGFIRRSGSSRHEGPDISSSISDRADTAEVIASIALEHGDKGFVGDEQIEMMVGILRSNPDYKKSEPLLRVKMALDIMDIFETLDNEEMRTAIDLYESIVEVSCLSDKFTLDTKLKIVPEEFREALSGILIAEKKEEDAVITGEAHTFGTQLPLLIVEHAREIVRKARYDRERLVIEKSLWDVDDDISYKARAALKASFGMDCSFWEASDILTSLSAKRISELGLGGAIAEMCKLWQYMRSLKMDDSLAMDGISALGTIYDSDIPPKNLRVVNILAEISTAGSFTDPYTSLVDAIRRLPK